MYGIDISNYQDKINLSKYDCDFVIMKATEGAGLKDKSFHKFAIQSTELGCLLGCYHFARPDLNGTIYGMRKEADFFIKSVADEGLIGKSILVLDWEVEPMDREDLVCTFIQQIEQKTGVTPFIYGSNYKMRNDWKNWRVMKNTPAWVASWPSIQPQNVGTKFWGRTPSKSGLNWKIWQYSSKGRWPEFNGYVDLDYSDMTRCEWESYARGFYKPPETQEIINDEMKWAIDIGLFNGFPDGKFHPKESLTREQAAALFKRFYNITKGGD